jgi:hypothetical protein
MPGYCAVKLQLLAEIWANMSDLSIAILCNLDDAISRPFFLQKEIASPGRSTIGVEDAFGIAGPTFLR